MKEIQRLRNKEWERNNPVKTLKIKLKSAARVFLREYATQEEYEELLRIYEQRKDK